MASISLEIEIDTPEVPPDEHNTSGIDVSVVPTWKGGAEDAEATLSC